MLTELKQLFQVEKFQLQARFVYLMLLCSRDSLNEDSCKAKLRVSGSEKGQYSVRIYLLRVLFLAFKVVFQGLSHNTLKLSVNSKLKHQTLF